MSCPRCGFRGSVASTFAKFGRISGQIVRFIVQYIVY